MLHEILDGASPGATEWTESGLYSNHWYREQGGWSAIVLHGEGDDHQACWEVHVWLTRYDITEWRHNRKAFRAVTCPGLFHSPEHYPEQSERHVHWGEQARQLADTLLAERNR